MAEQPREEMQKRVLRKDDGRLMIVYQFNPAAGDAAQPSRNEGEQPQ